MAESFGVEGRGLFYEETGALRDVVRGDRIAVDEYDHVLRHRAAARRIHERRRQQVSPHGHRGESYSACQRHCAFP